MQDWKMADWKMQDWKMQDKMTVEPKASKNVRKSDTNSFRPEMLLGLGEFCHKNILSLAAGNVATN